jgi:hypothetical protein
MNDNSRTCILSHRLSLRTIEFLCEELCDPSCLNSLLLNTKRRQGLPQGTQKIYFTASINIKIPFALIKLLYVI